jgi:hypothetical protein
MNTHSLSLLASLALALLVAGCNEQDTKQIQDQSLSPSAAVTDSWLGKWTGPEGTFLQLVGGSGKYEVTIQNLDGPRVFTGHAVSNGIEFERDGVKEVIHATNGVETGMKWLTEKSNCLTVHAGEGYCKD